MKPRDGTDSRIGAEGDDAGIAEAVQANGIDVEALCTLARQHDIGILQDPALTQVLEHIPTGATIPTQVFTALATLLDFVVTAETTLERRSEEERE